MKDKSYHDGIRDGVRRFAHWVDGVQFVGTTGKTLSEALREIDAEEFQEYQPVAEPTTNTTDQNPNSEQIHIWADGACKGNPGVGGWGVLIKCGDQSFELFGGEPATTNNRMELRAVIEALNVIPPDSGITLYTDSQYVQKGMSEWITGWKRKDWKGVKNVDLWKQLDDVSQQYDIEWVWVKGHASDIGNIKADELANKGVLTVRT